MTDQTRHEQAHRLSSIGGLTMLAGSAGRLVDHPCIKHKSLSMTLVYARIADRVVADEYFAVSEQVEASSLERTGLGLDPPSPAVS